MQKASTITMTTGLTVPINIELAFELFNIIHPRNDNGTRFIHPRNTRDKIPFFGVPNAIVCLKYKGKIRGIRQNEGQMNNVVSIDLQIENKNINLKLAKTKLQLTGANSEEQGREAFEVLCAHLNMIQGHLNHIKELHKSQVMYSIEWVKAQVMQSLALDLDFLRALPDDNLDKRTALFLWQYAEDFDEPLEFLQKMESVLIPVVLTGTNLCMDGEEVDITTCQISNSVYNYSLNKEVSLIRLSKFLHSQGFSVEFHNWNSAQMKVTIPIDERDDISSDAGTTSTGSSGSKKKIKAHRFSVSGNAKFSVKMTCPTSYQDAVEAYNLFMSAIDDFYNQDNA